MSKPPVVQPEEPLDGSEPPPGGGDRVYEGTANGQDYTLTVHDPQKGVRKGETKE